MSKSTIKVMGDSHLIQKSELITNLKSFDHSVIRKLENTMSEHGGVGIAGPQIGINKRVIIFGFEKNHRYPNEKPVPRTILINPEYDILSNELVSGWEKCLSIPGMIGLVPRYNKIRYRGYDEQGNFIERTADGFHARIIQHEVDHLDGILFPTRIQDLKDFGFEEALIVDAQLK